MSHVATLIAAPGVPLDDGAVMLAASVLPGARPSRRLDAGAVDIPFAPSSGHHNGRVVEDLRAALAGAPIDIVVQLSAGRRKRLLVADMDSTLIDQECLDELADAVGLRAEVSAITLRSVRGEMDFDLALRERVALLAGLDVGIVARIAEDRLTPTAGAETLIATMRAHGAATALVSGGFTAFTSRVACRLGLDRHHANVLEVRQGRLTGEVRAPILGRAAKREILRQIRTDLAIMSEQVIAVGDGANDLDMLGEAGIGVAYRAQPAVAAAASARIDHGDLTALLFVQGYAVEDFRR